VTSAKSFKDLARDWLPPALARLARRLTPRPAGQEPEYEYAGEQWTDTFRGQPLRGWDVEQVARTEEAKWDAFVAAVSGAAPLAVAHEAPLPFAPNLAAHNMAACFGYVLALASRGKNSLSVLDWGGGLGHYYILAKALLPEVTIHYAVRDLPPMCRAGRRLLPTVAFHETDETSFASRYDVVVASSSLQYAPDWRAALRKLSGAAAAWLYLARVPTVKDSPSFVMVQRPRLAGYATEYAGWVLNRAGLLAELDRAGMAPRREFLMGERLEVAGAREAVETMGFLSCPKGGAK